MSGRLHGSEARLDAFADHEHLAGLAKAHHSATATPEHHLHWIDWRFPAAIAAAVRAVMVARTEWTGTASELLGALAELAGERVAKSKTWPDSPRALAGRLRRAATFLRKIGIEITFGREGRARTRIIHITTGGTPPAPEAGGTRPSAPSAPSALAPDANRTSGVAAPSGRTVGARVDDAAGATVLLKPLNGNDATDAGGADANRPLYSGPPKSGWSARL